MQESDGAGGRPLLEALSLWEEAASQPASQPARCHWRQAHALFIAWPFQQAHLISELLLLLLASDKAPARQEGRRWPLWPLSAPASPLSFSTASQIRGEMVPPLCVAVIDCCTGGVICVAMHV